MESERCEQTNVLKSENEENDDEERKHFCKVISAFRFYRSVQVSSGRMRGVVGGRGSMSMLLLFFLC